MKIAAILRRTAAAFAVLAAAGSAEAASPDVVISQVYGGGGNTGATLRNDFIELFNRGTSAVDMTGWSVQYASSAGVTWQRTNISGFLQPGQYYLVQEAAGTGGTQSLPTPDATGSIAMSATAGKVALVTNQVLLTCGTATNSCIGLPQIKDFVGFGTAATNFEGSGPTPTLSNTIAALRDDHGCEDTDDNAADFATGGPTPRNTASPIAPCNGPTPPSGTAVATPASVAAGDPTLLTVAVTPGQNPTSTGLSVAGNLSAIGGPSSTALFDDGTNGDATAGDLTFSLLATVAPGTPSGPRVIPFVISDGQGRSGTTSVTVSVQAVERTIAAIQGPGTHSPFAGQLVTTRGIVTARKNNGFFLQTPDLDVDPDPATSEGIFVFTSAAPPAAAAVGNAVLVTATIAEFVPSQDPSSPPMTELTFATVSFVSSGNALPEPVDLAPDATLPHELFERFEGMRVRASLDVVAPTDGNVSEPNATSTSTGLFYAVLAGTPRPFREAGINALDPLPPGAPADVPRFDENPERIRVDSDAQEGAAGVEVSSGAAFVDVIGVLDFGFRSYTLLPDPNELASQVGAAVPVRLPAADEFTVAAFNLERFFDTVNDPNIGDPVLTPAAFERRLRKASLAIRTVMRSPDILGVEEAENLSTLETLAARINADAVAAGDPDPGYVAYLVEGNDVGGIDVGVLLRAPRVALVSVTQVGKDATYTNPQNGQQELMNDRPPLVVRGRVLIPGHVSYPVAVVVNHLRSLLGMEDPVDGVRVRAKRAAQAEFLAELLDGLQSPRAAVAAVGDFNAFQVNDGFVDVMGVVKGAPAPPNEVVTYGDDLVDPDYVNLADDMPPASAYSYSFEGNAQILDHVVASRTLAQKLRTFTYARNDADFPESLRNDATRPERISDHDMPVAYFRHPRADLSLAKTASAAEAGGTVTYTITAGNAGPDFAEQVTVSDTLPAGTTFEAVAAPADWTCTTPPVGSGGVVTCSGAEIAAGDAAPVLVSARIGCLVANGTLIVNAASGTAQWDPNVANNGASAPVSVTNPPPAVTGAAADRPLLWPPNHRMVDVAVTYQVSDACDPAPSCVLTVTSNEPVNGTDDGDTAPDWAVVDAGHVRLRAERSGSGSGRVYTIGIACTDNTGGVGHGQAAVVVPLSN